MTDGIEPQRADRVDRPVKRTTTTLKRSWGSTRTRPSRRAHPPASGRRGALMTSSHSRSSGSTDTTAGACTEPLEAAQSDVKNEFLSSTCKPAKPSSICRSHPAAPTPLRRCDLFKRRDTERFNRVQNEPHQLIFRQPAAHFRWQRKDLITQHRTAASSHTPPSLQRVLPIPADTAFCDRPISGRKTPKPPVRGASNGQCAEYG